MTPDIHIEDQEDRGGRCPLGACSSHACGGPTDESGVPMLGRVPGIAEVDDSAPGCGVHLGEALVTRDPELWVGLVFETPTGDTDPDRDARSAVTEFAEHVALDVLDRRAEMVDDPDEVVSRPVDADELARAVEYALATVGVA
ncbi:hypothetical protein OG948_42110 (plasmid) [Embleya sp. NBC_00888]|uniref:hypothetical protein n=1 Tax=Embleya sp. NBC_00888 TaxID=2975960 RepID=UPI002F917A3E|nr:hypothetical protein OG948_42110 [Embleya sp. NBC_00888]